MDNSIDPPPDEINQAVENIPGVSSNTSATRPRHLFTDMENFSTAPLPGGGVDDQDQPIVMIVSDEEENISSLDARINNILNEDSTVPVPNMDSVVMDEANQTATEAIIADNRNAMPVGILVVRGRESDISDNERAYQHF